MAGTLASQVGDLESADLARFDSVQIDAALAFLGRLDGWKAKTESDLLARAAALAADGAAPDPEDSLRKHQRGSGAENRKKTRRARTAAKAPDLADAMGAGATTAGHVDAVAAAARGLEPEQQDALFDAANAASADAEAMTVDAWRRKVQRMLDRIRADEGLDRDAEQRRTTKLTKWVNSTTGMYVINGEFHPELGDALFARLDGEVERLWRASNNDTHASIPDAQRRNERLAAEAMVSLVAASHAGSCTSTPDVMVLIDDRTLETGVHDRTVSETSMGGYLPPDTIRRLCCDSGITPVFRGAEGDVLHVGRTVRSATPAQKRALRAMYRTCAFDGCAKSFAWCQMHHVEPWSTLGPTDLDNLIPLCHLHHHKVHEGRWHVKLLPDRSLKIYRPNGSHYTTTQPPTLIDVA